MTQPTISKPRTGPSEYEDQAIAAAGRSEYTEAARLFRKAAGACIGHGRAERYEEAAKRMIAMAADSGTNR